VVVRRLVPGESGPTGGPAFTDLLGVCTAWQDGVCVVQPEAGDAVAIPWALIVSGKPVPPRAAPRQRISVRDAELRTAPLSAGVEVQPLGDWLLRWEPAPVGRARKRFNSCLAVGDAPADLERRAAQVSDFYAQRGRPALIQVERGSQAEEELRDLGWRIVPDGDAHFLLASLSRVRRILGVSGAPVTRQTPSIECEGPRAAVAIGAAARGEAGVDGDWLGLHNLVVQPAYRRQGLARAVLRELLDWGGEQGATTVWLHVQTDNEPALALYETLGFARHHTCRYVER
jgi:ribosomal protein S18 acetylase RimI-like enzyme